jgi:uncharacterized membrane protein YhaH (DUF805 family)
MSIDTTTAGASLSQPLYGATFGQAISRFFKKYATFSGRASRSEFWWVALLVFLVNAVISTIMSFGIVPDENGVYGPTFAFALVLNGIWFLATIVPWLAVVWRRLHDTNKGGPFYFLVFIPLVGGIIVLILLALPSDPAGARFDR